jgi:hypothetical protein
MLSKLAANNTLGGSMDGEPDILKALFFRYHTRVKKQLRIN